MTNEQTRYSRLAQITKLINTNLELREALEHVVTAISEEIVSCDSVGIYLPRKMGPTGDLSESLNRSMEYPLICT
ncbi:hypothetical protein [Halobacillus andaensis]|uniref:hypothetical protein n=1 Tax=Halobacillus andaensis TaxID=1176239 RepID=UPI003D709F39